jgi:hypothetical protein
MHFHLQVEMFLISFKSSGGCWDSRIFFYHTSVKLVLSFVLFSWNNDQSLVIFSVDRDYRLQFDNLTLVSDCLLLWSFVPPPVS